MMNDRYIYTTQQIDRLIKDWIKHGSLIVAFDYDNTIFDYHDRGDTYTKVIHQLSILGKMGCKLICFTSCDPSRFDEIRIHCKNNDIFLQGINIDSDVPFKGRKIYFNVLYDDRAGLGQIVGVMGDVISHMKAEIFQRCPIKNHDVLNGRICAYSGKPFIYGEWHHTNGLPAAYPEYRKENDIIPDIHELMKLNPRKL